METFQDILHNTSFLMNWYDVSVNSNNKGEFVDPLSIIVILALLKYKQIGTKLHFRKSSICIDELLFTQGMFRKLSGNRKEDLKRLYQPIIYACKYFLKPCNNEQNIYMDIKTIFSLAITGLKNLRQTYKLHDDIVNMINIYINLIDRSINEYDTVMNFLEDLLKLSEPHIDSNDSNMKKMISMKKDVYYQLNSIWSTSRIYIVINLFKELDTKIDSERQNIIKSIASLLCDCNYDVQNLLKNFSE